jgi:tRNA threonylcarbamoyladenosine biosynthesis protein TsaB
VLTLAFDTATDVATAALVRGGTVLGERRSRAVRILADVEGLLADGGVARSDVRRLVVGTGPGSYTGLRMGLVTARTLALALDVPVAGVSTLAALAAGARGATPVLDARRREVFTLVAGEPSVLSPDDLRVRSGDTYVGDGALRYRDSIEGRGGIVPPDEDDAHVPWARHHAALAAEFGPAELVEPLYLRVPDAEVTLREGRLRV